MHVLSSQQHKLLMHAFHIHSVVLHEQMVMNKLVLTVVILNGSKASEPLTNSRALKLYS